MEYSQFISNANQGEEDPMYMIRFIPGQEEDLIADTRFSDIEILEIALWLLYNRGPKNPTTANFIALIGKYREKIYDVLTRFLERELVCLNREYLFMELQRELSCTVKATIIASRILSDALQKYAMD